MWRRHWSAGCCPCSPNIEPTEGDIQLRGQDRLASAQRVYERPEFGVPRQCCSYPNLYNSGNAGNESLDAAILFQSTNEAKRGSRNRPDPSRARDGPGLVICTSWSAGADDQLTSAVACRQFDTQRESAVTSCQVEMQLGVDIPACQPFIKAFHRSRGRGWRAGKRAPTLNDSVLPQ